MGPDEAVSGFVIKRTLKRNFEIIDNGIKRGAYFVGGIGQQKACKVAIL